jgi:hypothetical protein
MGPPLKDPHLSTSRISKRGCQGTLGPMVQACQFWQFSPAQATGGRRLWDVPPTVTLGEDLQQGRHDRTRSDRFAAVFGCCKSSNLLNVTLSFVHIPKTCTHFHAEEPVPRFAPSSRCHSSSLRNTLSLI